LEVELPQTSIDLKAFSQGLAVCGRNHDQSQVLICSFILQRIFEVTMERTQSALFHTDLHLHNT
jgi:hypothetical protein